MSVDGVTHLLLPDVNVKKHYDKKRKRNLSNQDIDRNKKIAEVKKATFDTLTEQRKQNLSKFPPTLVEGTQDQQVLKLYTKIAESPKASALLEEALKVNATVYKSLLTIKIVPKDKAPLGALCIFNDNIIYLSEDRSENEKLSLLLFELTNLTHRKKFEAIHESVKNKKIKRARLFARAMERVEYQGVLQHHAIVQACINDEGWDAAVDVYDIDWDFKKFLKFQIEKKHYDYYLDYFKKNYAKKP